jgi:membrane fusion protein, multidrug efflux system
MDDMPICRESTRSRARGLVLPTVVVSLLLVLAAGGCGKDGGGGANASNAQPSGSGAPAQPPVPVAVAPAELGAISSYYNATATLEAEKQAQVLARVAGVVRSLAVEEGDQVRAGDVLLQIDNAEYQLRVDQAAARTANLEARFQRMTEMLAQGLTSSQDFETAKSELATAKSDEGLARLSLSYTSVAAPFAGRVTRRLVNVGQTASIGTPLFDLADFDPLLARVHVPAKEFRRLLADQPVELTLDSVDQRLQGRITLVSPVIDPQSGTIKVTIEIASYPAGVRPGDFAEVRIVTDSHQRAMLVPRLAVISEKGEDVVYVAAADSTAERRVVTLGFSDNVNAEILTGVKAGDLVVVKGQRSLKHGAPIKILPDDTPVAARREDA